MDTPQPTVADPVIDPRPVLPLAAAPLTYHEQRTYRPTGKFKLGGFFLALVAGVVTSILSALAVWVWMSFVNRSLIFGVLLPVLAQGVAVGGVLMALFRRAKMRNLPLAVTLGLLLGVFSDICFEASLYVHTVHRQQRRVQLDLADDGVKPDSPLGRQLNSAMARPYDFYDRLVLLPKTRHRGLVGFLYLRLKDAPQWVLLHIAIVGTVAGFCGHAAAARPFCEACACWYGEEFNGTLLPGVLAEPLVEAVDADDPTMVLAVIHTAASLNSGTGRAVTRIQRCPKCLTSLADVKFIYLGADKKNKNKTLRRRQRVSTETVNALTTEIPPPPADTV